MDSAGGNLKLMRNKVNQAILPIRGKMLNTRKAKVADIQKNAEIMTLIEALGLDYDPQTLKLVYDKKKLRYGKIIIMADGDIDGAHIKNLFYTNIWHLCPELILNGHVYAGEPPLYRVTLNKDKYLYLKDDRELAEYRKKTDQKNLVLTRMKG